MTKKERIAELERKVVELEEKLSRATLIDWSKSQLVSFPNQTACQPATMFGFQSCPLCHASYRGAHVCWTVNPNYVPFTFSNSTADIVFKKEGE
jgi:hypothetical protein